jgi:hypothetical protein
MTGNDTRREGSAKQNHAGTGPQEKELAEVCARFADLCQYFSQQNMDLPPEVVEQVRPVSKLGIDNRIARLKSLNQELLEYLNDAGPNPQVRQ